jgi:hypothetical protein
MSNIHRGEAVGINCVRWGLISGAAWLIARYFVKSRDAGLQIPHRSVVAESARGVRVLGAVDRRSALGYTLSEHGRGTSPVERRALFIALSILIDRLFAHYVGNERARDIIS